MRRFIILAAAALTLSACAQTLSQAEVAKIAAGNQAAVAKWEAEMCLPGEPRDQCERRVLERDYRAMHNCSAAETYRECRARVDDANAASNRANQERERLLQAAALECRYQATAATFNLSNDGSLFYGALNQRFQENKLYGQCMEAQAARMGY